MTVCKRPEADGREQKIQPTVALSFRLPIQSDYMPTETDQIRALLNQTAHDLVRVSLGKEQLTSGDYERVMTVSFDAVVEYLVANCSIDEVASVTKSPKDGYYALPERGFWLVYDQERACHRHREVVNSEQAVFAHFTKHVLGIRPKGES